MLIFYILDNFATFKTRYEDLPQIRDKNDQMFLILAVVGKAEILVTGDADILEIKPIFHTPPIMTLTEFKEWLKV